MRLQTVWEVVRLRFRPSLIGASFNVLFFRLQMRLKEAVTVDFEHRKRQSKQHVLVLIGSWNRIAPSEVVAAIIGRCVLLPTLAKRDTFHHLKLVVLAVETLGNSDFQDGAEVETSYSIVIPAYNEAERIGPTLERTLAYFADRQNTQVEVLVVDDGSTDNTESIVESWQERSPYIRLLSHEENGGQRLGSADGDAGG